VPICASTLSSHWFVLRFLLLPLSFGSFGGCFAAVAAWVDAWPPRRFGLHAHSAAERVMALITDALP